ncbi:MAG: hypothetical protein ACTSP3_05895, partial [Candidatus Heimdallarchaeaceae archaeon]
LFTGIKGVFIAFVAIEGLHTILVTYLLNYKIKLVKLHIYFKHLVPTFIVLGLLITAFLLSDLLYTIKGIFLILVSGFLLFLLFSYFSNTIPKDEFRKFLSKKNKNLNSTNSEDIKP